MLHYLHGPDALGSNLLTFSKFLEVSKFFVKLNAEPEQFNPFFIAVYVSVDSGIMYFFKMSVMSSDWRDTSVFDGDLIKMKLNSS